VVTSATAHPGFILGQAGGAEVLDADVMGRVDGASDTAGDRVQFDADESHPDRGVGKEVADAAPRFEDRRIIGYAETGKGLVDGPDDDG
jgi:hypothetical protein